MSDSPWAGEATEIAHRDACEIDHVITITPIRGEKEGEVLIRVELVMKRRKYVLSAAWANLDRQQFDEHFASLQKIKEWFDARETK